VIGLTESLAKEFGPDNIRINAILPRIVERPRMDNVIRARAAETGVSFKDMADEHMKRVSLRRMVSPGDIASSVDYLLSEFGKNISGQSLAVDGNIETL
jgi:NAD(P)-dependent dehydrogenase (short-subunit alcohol dehydrogenase family)